MAGAFDKILDSLGRSRTGELSSIQSFPPLDIPGIAGDLQLQTRARKSAEKGRPDTRGTELDATELDVYEEIENRARKATEDYRSQVALYEARIRRALITHDQRIPIEAAAQNVLANFEAQTVDDLNHLAVLEAGVKGHEQEFREFRRIHRLWRLPILFSTGEVRARWLAIAAIYLLESLMNGMFFAPGSSAGLIGGIMEAMVLSALNIGVAILCALYVAPFVNRRDLWGRLFGISGVALWIAWLLSLNVAIAHFRDLFILNEGEVSWAMWWERISNWPIEFYDGRSVILCALGIGLGLFSLIEAYRTQDPHPGYGALARRRIAAIQDYAESQSQCLASLQSLRDEAVEEMTAVIDTIRTSEYELRVAIEGRERLYQNYRNYLSALKTGLRRLLKEYRETNELERSTAAPAYFGQPIAMPEILEPDSLSPLDIESDVRSVIVELLEKYIKEINQGFRDAFPKYRSVDALTDSGSPNAFA